MNEGQMNIKIEEVTPEMAESYLASNTGNRTLRASRIASYAEQMKREQWKVAGDPIRFDSTGRLIDGQHRLNAVVASGKTQTFVVVRNLEPEIFAVVDTGLGRSPGDALGVDVVGNSHKAAAIRLLYVVEAGGDPRQMADRTAVTRIDIMEYYQNHRDEMEVTSLAGDRMYKNLAGGNRSAWISFAVMTYRVNPIWSNEFLEGVRVGSLIQIGDSRLALRNFLAGNIGRTKKINPSGDHLGIYIKAWNSWMKGDSCHRLRLLPSEPFPEIVSKRPKKKV